MNKNSAFWILIKPTLLKLLFLYKKIKAFPKSIRLMRKLRSEKKKAVLFITPHHGNLGDQAITIAEYRLLTRYLPGVKIFEIPCGELGSSVWNKRTLRKCISGSDLVCINGGGFLGTLWIKEEMQIRKILSLLPDRRILILPQTMLYEQNAEGEAELRTSQKIYAACSHLTVFMREKTSYDFFCRAFKGPNCYLIPDMALLLDAYGKPAGDTGCGILLCFRQDLERTQDSEAFIQNELQYLSEPFRTTDTVVDHHILPAQRETEVRKKLDEFASAKLVITDRLHGMILAAIAETPCVVLLSRSHKVDGVYEWIRDLDYIELVRDVSQIRQAVDKVLSAKRHRYDNTAIETAFEPLKQALCAWYESTFQENG